MSLFGLPVELVLQVVAHLANEKYALCSLAQTCRLLQDECEKHIYADINLLSTDDLKAIIEAFESRPERIASVETLKIAYSYHDSIQATLQERMRFNACLPKMRALKHWYVESPFDNFKWNKQGGHEWVEHDMEEIRKAIEASCLHTNLDQNVGLSKLEKLEIHSHGAAADFWNLDGFHCLFRHPTLRQLHASCFVLPADLPELEAFTRSTPLTTLVFDECILNPKSLGRILRTPKNLKHLTLGENVYNGKRGILGPKGLTLRPLETLQALAEVAHSLESLIHYDPQWRIQNQSLYRSNPLKSDGLRDFHSLKYLDIDPCSFLHQAICSSAQVPPNLETLRIHHALAKFFDVLNDNLFDLFEEMPSIEPYARIPSLKTLEFVQAASMDSHRAEAEHICRSAFVRDRHASAYKLFKRGINMKMFLEATWREGLMPPYLHGEQKPETVCVYDAAEVGFRRHIVEDVPSDYMRAVEMMQSRHGIPSEYKVPDTEPPETGELNYTDIMRLVNQVRRTLDSLCNLMELRSSGFDDDDEDDEDGDAEDDDTAEAYIEHLMGLDSDDEWVDEDEDMEFDGWLESDIGGSIPFDIQMLVNMENAADALAHEEFILNQQIQMDAEAEWDDYEPSDYAMALEGGYDSPSML